MKGKMGIFIAILFVVGLTGYALGDGQHTMKVVPEEKTVGLGETFTIDVNIVPSSPVSSAFCNLTFDPDILQAVSISNGNMFDLWLGDLPGVADIDNTNGTITYIMAASSASTSGEGTFFTVTFQAVAAGVSYINLEDAVVQGTSDINVINGTVTVVQEGDYTPPEITLVTYPGAIIEDRDVNFEWTATDDNSPLQNITFAHMLSPYETVWSTWGHVTQASYNDLDAGTYTFRIKAKDDAGNIAYLNYSFQIVDNEAPVIASVKATPTTQAVNGDVNITCTITDTFGVDEAKVVITYPDATVHEFALSHDGKYYLNQPYTMEGVYEFHIYARDVNGNEANSPNYQFTMVEGDFVAPSITDVAVSPLLQDVGANVTISCIVIDNVALQDVRVNMTLPDGSHLNFSIFANKTGDTYYSIRSYNITGDYTFFIYAVDTSGNANISEEKEFTIDDISPPTIGDITIEPMVQNIGDNLNISCIVVDNVALQDVRINIEFPDGSHINVSILANVTGNIYFLNRTYPAEGTYTFFIYAVDTSGNANTSEEHTFQIKDLNPPQVKITFPEGGDVVGGSILIKWNASDESGEVDITLKYSPNNGQTWTLIVEHTANDGEYLWNASNLADGDEYIIQIIAVDASGNTARYFTDTFTMDNTAPTLDISKPKAGRLYIFDREVLPILGSKAIIIGKITIQAEATDSSGIDKVEFYVDGSYKATDSTQPYEWTWSEKTLGKHTLKVIAYDKAGNKISEEREVFVINPL
ncbi:MAG: hypothetical protein J7L31_07395 [Thermoplasmata archaeon]|nr:hypothetical protein [Thermoplasmata archaeon]